MNSEQDVLDDIDALVDWQLQQEASGYDHNINQVQCPHCDRDFHGLAITEDLESLRQRYRWGMESDDSLGDYDYRSDDSFVLCPGSRFIGPRADRRAIKVEMHARAQRAKVRDMLAGCRERPNLCDVDGIHLGPLPSWLTKTAADRAEPSNPFSPVEWQASKSQWGFADGGWISPPSGIDSLRFPPEFLWPRPFVMPSVNELINHALGIFGGQLSDLVAGWGGGPPPRWETSVGSWQLPQHTRVVHDEATPPDTRTPQQRALPRPATTPPMWAHDPTRSRRPRRHHNQPNRQASN